MRKTFCDRCGKEKTKYGDLGYHIIVSHTQLKDLCKDCFKEINRLIEGFMKKQKEDLG